MVARLIQHFFYVDSLYAPAYAGTDMCTQSLFCIFLPSYFLDTFFPTLLLNEGCHETLQTPIGPVTEEERVPRSAQKLLNKAAFLDLYTWLDQKHDDSKLCEAHRRQRLSPHLEVARLGNR